MHLLLWGVYGYFTIGYILKNRQIVFCELVQIQCSRVEPWSRLCLRSRRVWPVNMQWTRDILHIDFKLQSLFGAYQFQYSRTGTGSTQYHFKRKNLKPAPQHGPWSIYKPSQDQFESQDHQDPSILSQVKDKTCGLKTVYLKGGSLYTVIPRLTSPPCSLLSPRRRNKQSRFTIISFTQRSFPHISLYLKALPEPLARSPRCELESIRWPSTLLLLMSESSFERAMNWPCWKWPIISTINLTITSGWSFCPPSCSFHDRPTFPSPDELPVYWDCNMTWVDTLSLVRDQIVPD